MGEKRRSRALSRSIYFRYSSRVVAPMQRSSPLARAGFIMLEASIAPWAAPAPTTVCSSSMNRTISPSARWISSRAAFKRSSNSPRKRVPATMLPRFSEITRLPQSGSGTSPAMIFCARPSTMAVLPTPASPMRTGLFLVLRDSTCMTRAISASRPMTGSSLPSRASWVKFRLNFSRVR